MDNENLGSLQGAEAEKMVPQSTVNAVIKREKEEAAERVRRQMEAEFQEKLKSVQPVDKEALFSEFENRWNAKNEERRIQTAEIQQKAENERLNREYGQIKTRYANKLLGSKDLAEDFDEVMNEFPHDEYPALIIAAEQLPNTAEVMYYLATNPEIADRIHRVSEKNWPGFMKEMKKISNISSKNEEAAKGEMKLKAPLSKNKSSVVGENDDHSSWASIKSDKSLRF